MEVLGRTPLRLNILTLPNPPSFLETCFQSSRKSAGRPLPPALRMTSAVVVRRLPSGDGEPAFRPESICPDGPDRGRNEATRDL